MQVTLKKVEAYEVFADGKSLGRFSKGSEWNGLSELTSSRGKLIIIDRDPFNVLLDGLFATTKPESVVECLMATPGLLPVAKADAPPPATSEVAP